MIGHDATVALCGAWAGIVVTALAAAIWRARSRRQAERAFDDMELALRCVLADYSETGQQFWGAVTQTRNSTIEAARAAVKQAEGVAP